MIDMPLSQNDPTLDYDGSWGDASKSWPKLTFADAAEAKSAYFLAVKVVPYGSYVLVDRELRLEHQDLVEMIGECLSAAGWRSETIWRKP